MHRMGTMHTQVALAGFGYAFLAGCMVFGVLISMSSDLREWVGHRLPVWDKEPPSAAPSVALHYQYLSGLLIGLGMGGVVGASTLGVAMFSLVAPQGHLKEFTAVIPVVNSISSLATVSVYLNHCEWNLVWQMWPMIMLGIVMGTGLLPLIQEHFLRKLTSAIYGMILLQRLVEKAYELGYLGSKSPNKQNANVLKQAKVAQYRQYWVSSAVSVFCGVVTVVTNNSGPIFNIYLLACGLDMDGFVATRSVMMAGKNVAKVLARIGTGGLCGRELVHGLCVGAMTPIGIQLAKPIKARTSPEFYTYFTWGVLLYTAVRMWH